MGRTHRVHGGLSPVGGTPQVMQGKSVRNPLPVEEVAAETMSDELTSIPTPHPPVPLRAGGRENCK